MKTILSIVVLALLGPAYAAPQLPPLPSGFSIPAGSGGGGGLPFTIPGGFPTTHPAPPPPPNPTSPGMPGNSGFPSAPSGFSFPGGGFPAEATPA